MEAAIDRIDLEADRLVGHYRRFQLALTAVFDRAVLDPAFPARRPRQAAVTALRDLVAGAEDRLAPLFAFAAGRLINHGLADGRAGVGRIAELVERYPGWEAATRELIAHIEGDLRAQVRADARRVETEIAREVLRRERENAQTRATRLTRVGVEFERTDRAGRRWDSERYVRTHARGALLALYNDSVVHALADRGVWVARLNAPGHRQHDVRFALTANDVLPSYEQVRRDLLHPNSVAVVRMIT